MKFTEEKIQFAGNIEFAGSYDEGEKELIGKVWADKSGNLFLMAWKKDDLGRNISQQINEVR
jgi:hypothetical protein